MSWTPGWLKSEIKDLIKDTCKIKFMMIPKINIKAADGGD